MTELHTIRSAAHVSVLDVWEGYGVLIRPCPAGDVLDPVSGASLHAADWDAHVREVLRLGFEPETNDFGDLVCEPLEDTKGYEVVVLVGDALSSGEDAVAFAAARSAALSTALGLTRGLPT